MKQPKIETTAFALIFCASLIPLIAGSDVREDAEAEFQKADANRDGKVTPAEHATWAREMFVMMDADADGKVTAAEVDAAYEKRTGKKGEKPAVPAAEKIKAIDGDGDGTLTLAEQLAGAAVMFGRMDTDENDELSKAEVVDGHVNLLAKHHGSDL